MPIRVTIELIPGGDLNRAEMLEQITITQVHAFDTNPGGVREYLVTDNLAGGEPLATVRHERRWGAGPLVQTAVGHICRNVVL